MSETTYMNTELFFKSALAELKIDSQRTQLLQSISSGILEEIRKNRSVNLNFICTHNSRRSQLAQVWGSYAANYFKLSDVHCFSGGTAVTAFFRNTVKTLQEVGFTFQLLEFSHQNPIYAINYKNGINPIIGFSKLYDDVQNKKPFIAITTCNSADESCPVISNAIDRFHLPYIDPKVYDNAENQNQKYLETNKQIAGELHYIFKRVAELI